LLTAWVTTTMVIALLPNNYVAPRQSRRGA
jgi:hypothetical protein